MFSAFATRLRRRRTFVLLVVGLTVVTIYLCYSRVYDSMPLAAQGFHPAQSPEDAATTASGRQKQKGMGKEKKNRPADDGSQKPLRPAPMSYGTSARPPFKDLTNIIADLPEEFIPRYPGPQDEYSSLVANGMGRRLVIVGDVHGQKAALEALLAKVGFDRPKGDHLVLTGDLINKGLNSAGVVELAMKLKASAVRGNHEDRVLLVHAAMTAPLAPGTNGGSKHGLLSSVFGAGKDEEAAEVDVAHTDTLEQNPFSHGDAKDRATAASLTTEQLTWLASLPVILRIGDIPSSPLRNLVVVHAGLVPGLALKRQDPWAAMNMRSLVYPIDELAKEKIKKELEAEATRHVPGRRPQPTPTKAPNITPEMVDAAFARRGPQDRRVDDIALPVDTRDGDSWSDAWNRYQRTLPEERRATVVYGHDARTGLSVADGGDTYTFGLDSGCVYGRRLSALVIEAGKNGVTHRIVQVDCEKGRRG